jgi:hypothetical protein
MEGQVRLEEILEVQVHLGEILEVQVHLEETAVVQVHLGEAAEDQVHHEEEAVVEVIEEGAAAVIEEAVVQGVVVVEGDWLGRNWRRRNWRRTGLKQLQHRYQWLDLRYAAFIKATAICIFLSSSILCCTSRYQRSLLLHSSRYQLFAIPIVLETEHISS